MINSGLVIGSVFMFGLASLMQCRQGEAKLYEPTDFDERCRILALQDNEPGQRYKVSRQENEIHELDICYLGSVETKGDSVIKFISQIRYFGITKDSPRANGSLHLYNQYNQPIGYYNLGGANDVPKRLAGKSLIFDYTKGDCNQTTAISFADSIPIQMFINCTNHGGNLWQLERSHYKVVSRHLE